mmetsp:Transcript_284/g.548  ORF Transcript_284/g.548 Transcript_284/m.548 type:complete len:413 (-) Transcript_284:48-1286(-)
MFRLSRSFLGPKGLLARFASTSTETKNRLVYTNKLDVWTREKAKTIPTYRVMDEEGKIIDPSQDPQLPQETCIKMYKNMVGTAVMDNILYDIQRQGRISFYMTSYGEEATHLSAVALDNDDIIFLQYREVGVLLWRGFTVDDCINQCYSNRLDPGKGRQMPVHYGSVKHNVQTISSPLATQIPQAVGAAYAQRHLGKKSITAVYFGEGAASEGDFHAGLNFAATLKAPVVFFCRNNGYAISTPSEEQFRGDGIASRGPAYGLDTIRVDGNDAFAVYNSMKEAKSRALEDRPVLIEAMTYRVGHHSTSDDSSHYRKMTDVENWVAKNNPIKRLKNYLVAKDWWNDELDEELRKSARKGVLQSMKRAEAEKKPSIDEMFTDVYDTMPSHLVEQQRELQEHLQRNADQYDVHQFA